MEFDFDKLFKFTVSALNLNRSHPFIQRDKKWLFQFIMMHGVFTVGFVLVLYNIICYDIKMNNFAQTCKNAVMIVVYTMITYQYCLLLVHQKSLTSLINNMKNDFELVKSMSPEEQAVVFEYANKGSFVSKQWMFLTGFGTFVFLGKTVVLYVYYYFIDEFRLVPFYGIIYPAAIEDRKDKIIMYISTYIFELYYDLYAAVMYVAFVPLAPIFMLHVGGQLQVVRMRIYNIFAVKDDQIIWAKLKDILNRLQYIQRFMDDLKDCFKINYEITLKLASIVLPLGIYEIMVALKQGELSIEIVSFVVGAVMISSAPCYYSNMLIDKGENIRLGLYSCGWEQHFNRRTRTTIQLMMLQALRPIALHTVFKTLSLETLTDVYQQSYTIFNVMNTMWH